jgi:branched-chain amino acid transport system ATP-binding protein
MTLHLTEISGGYGDTLVHRSLSLSVAPGEVVAVVGRNGTGKTTLARLVTGELPLAGGTIRLGERALGPLPGWARAKAGVVSMPQTGMVFDSLSVRENLALTGAAPDALAAIQRRFPRLPERAGQRAGSMSGGERKILGFARSLLMAGTALVLDEPSEGVQPENIAHMQDLILARRQQGGCILLLEQNVSMILAVADRVVALDAGGIGFTLDKEQITRDAVLTALRV